MIINVALLWNRFCLVSVCGVCMRVFVCMSVCSVVNIKGTVLCWLGISQPQTSSHAQLLIAVYCEFVLNQHWTTLTHTHYTHTRALSGSKARLGTLTYPVCPHVRERICWLDPIYCSCWVLSFSYCFHSRFTTKFGINTKPLSVSSNVHTVWYIPYMVLHVLFQEDLPAGIVIGVCVTIMIVGSLW